MSALAIAIAALEAVPAVAALVGDRVYPVRVPQGFGRPCLVLNLLSESDEQMLTGAGGYFDARVQVECLANDPAAANSLGETVKMALGNCVKIAIAGAEDVDIWKAGADVTDHSDDRQVFRRVMDFRLRWRA